MKKDLFKVEKLAAEYCNQYNIKENNKLLYPKIINAFCVGYSFGKKKRRNYENF